MAVGKYSPTVSAAYRNNQNWFQYANDSFYDAEGYDSYGYNKDDVDRAGNHEFDYLSSITGYGDEVEYPLYEDTLQEWGYDPETKLPKKS